MPELRKREIAYKIRINDIFRGNPVFEEDGSLNKRLLHIGLGDKKIVRLNLIANVIEKYESEGERKFASITLDDGSGQIRARVFSEDVEKLRNITEGDTVILIGFLRSYNQEIYIIPEIIKKANPKYLLIRKLEIESSFKDLPSEETKKSVRILRDELIELIRKSEENEGIEKEEIILKIKAQPNLISQEIQKLLEEGIIYEPRPGRVRYLG
jgi:uncharacterized protein